MSMSLSEAALSAAESPAAMPVKRSLAIIAAASVIAGILSHQQWPGSIIALVAGTSLALLVRDECTTGWSRDTALSALYSCLALLSVFIDPGALNLALLWFGCAALALTSAGMSLALPAALLTAAVESIFRFLLPRTPKIDPGAASANLRKADGWFATLLLPVAAALIFGALFISANPLIAEFAARMSWSLPVTYLFSVSTPVALVAFLAMGVLMRMRARTASAVAAKLETANSSIQKYLSRASVVTTLVLLNLMFAAENVLDYAYIWQGIALPPGMSFTSYVHRGSYSLVATALLAAVLMIIIFRPGTDTQESRRARWLVYLFAFQNVLLVASTAKRTLAYVDYSGMTLWRLSALIWMGVVAAGLVLIAVRVWRNRTTGWLLNTNLSVAALMLLACSYMDFVGIVSRWNVDRAAAKGEIDFSYTYSLGVHALPALQELQARGLLKAGLLRMGPDMRNQLYVTPEMAIRKLETEFAAAQSSLITFTLRNWFITQETTNNATASRG
jgi:hypothetical protein